MPSAASAATPSSPVAGTAVAVPGTTALESVACTSSTTCVAVGQNAADGDPVQGVVVPVTNGAAGTTVDVSGTYALNGVACPSASICVAVGDDTSGAGTVLTLTNGLPGTAVPAPETSQLVSIACTTTTTCLAVGDIESASAQGAVTQGEVVPITNGVPGTGVVVAGTSNLAGVACPSPNTCEVAGSSSSDQGVVVTVKNGAAGSAQAVPGSSALYGVACPNVTTCETAGDNTSNEGLVASINNGSPGVAQVVPGTNLASGVACSNATNCLVTGTYFSGPSGLQAVVAPITDGAPSAAQEISGATGNAGVVCPSTGTCEVVSENETSTDPAGQGAVATVTDIHPLAYATFTNPLDGQTNVDTTKTFTWNTVPGAQGYVLIVGTTLYGSNLLNSGVLPPTTSSFTVPAFPSGQTLYATLFTKQNNAWTAFDEIGFNAAIRQATFTNPLNGQYNIDTAKAFTWTNIPDSQGSILVVGTTAFGTNLVNSGILPASQTSYTVPALPGGILFATLLTKVNGAFTRYQLIAFTAASGGASLVYPTNGQQSVVNTNGFQWATVPGAQGYLLTVGTTLYGTNIFNSGILAPTRSVTAIPALPSNHQLHATLFTETNGSWVNFQNITFESGS